MVAELSFLFRSLSVSQNRFKLDLPPHFHSLSSPADPDSQKKTRVTKQTDGNSVASARHKDLWIDEGCT